MTRILALIIGLSVAWTAPVAAQADDQTLADIRQEMSVLFVEVQRLKRELSTTGTPGANVGGNTPLERIDSIESALQKLTAKTEELENRINRVVADGTNQLGDLEFRVCELDANCDISNIPETGTLGGGNVSNAPTTPPPSTIDTTELAVGERSDFQRAQAALATGDFRGAADQFAAFTTTYPGGPMSADAHFLRGQAFENLGEMSNAARAYLDSFSGAPDGPKAPEALYKLGTSLGALGQQNESCVTLGEVEIRYPNSDMVLEAQSSMRNQGCS